MPQRMFFFSFFAITITKALLKWMLFLYTCSDPNQSHTTKGVFFCIFTIILTKTLPTKGVFFSICALILIKALQKRVFYSSLPLFYLTPCHKGCFIFYFCTYYKQSLATNVVFFFSFFARILI